MGAVPTPSQFTTTDGTLTGALNGQNNRFAFTPFTRTLLYQATDVTNALAFRNGVLIDEYADYAATPRAFTLPQSALPDTITARLYQGGGATKMRLSMGGMVANGTQSLRISGVDITPAQPFMLFRNGQLLTPGVDYLIFSPWIALTLPQTILADDSFIALIGMGGSECDTHAGTITGSIDGTNAVFGLPFAPAQTMLFRNGQLLTQGFDYSQSGATVILLGSQVPQVGDTLTAQIWNLRGPLQVSTIDGTLGYAVAAESLMFFNGLLQTQPADGFSFGDMVMTGNAPSAGDTVTLRSWVPNVLDAALPTGPLAFNLAQQFSTIDGSITGILNGVNNVFMLVTSGLVTEVQVFWNGDFQTETVDYSWACVQNSSAGPWITTVTMMAGQYPNAGDYLTVEAYPA